MSDQFRWQLRFACCEKHEKRTWKVFRKPRRFSAHVNETKRSTMAEAAVRNEMLEEGGGLGAVTVIAMPFMDFELLVAFCAFSLNSANVV